MQEKSAKLLNVQQIEKDKFLFEIEISKDKVERAINNAYREVAKKVNIPGFRRGKAPRGLLEKRFGKEYFYEEAQKELLTPAYIEILNEQNIRPIESELKDVFIEDGKPLVFKIEVKKEPVFDIKDYIGIPLTGNPIEVLDSEVENRLEILRNNFAKFEKITDRCAQNGDLVVIDYQGYINETPLADVKGNNVLIEIGSKRTIAGLEENIIGMNINEEKTVNLTFPNDYHNQEYAGKEVKFNIKLKEINIKILPEINDDFAKRLGEFNTISELREDIKKKLFESKTNHQKKHFKEQICNYLLEHNPHIEVSQVMVEKELDHIIRNYEIEFLYRRLDFHEYLKSVGQTIEDFRKKHYDDAVKNVKISIILSSIGEHEKIEANDEEVKVKISQIALSVGKTYPEMLKHVEERGELVYLKQEIVHQKVFDFLIEKANITYDPNYKCECDNHK